LARPEHSLLAATAVALAAGVVLWAGRDTGEVQAAGPLPEPRPEAPGRAAPGPPSLRSVEPAVAAAPGLAFLEEHYGPDAPAVLALLAAEGVQPEDLSEPLPEEELLALLPTWLVYSEAERADWLRTRAEWPEELNADWLSQRYGILVDPTPDQLATLDLLAELSRPDIELAIGLYMDELELAMLGEYSRGAVQVSPFVVWPPVSEQPDLDGDPPFYSVMRVGQGWIARVGVSAGRAPGAVAARSELAQQVHMRDQRIREALLALQ
jgi:hypothetical protein